MNESVFTKELTPFSDGYKAPSGSLGLSALGAKLQRYKRTVAKRYRIIFPEKIGEFLPEGKLYISTKVDGELWFLVKHAGEVALVAYNGRVLKGIPVCAEAEELLAKHDSAVVAGELFALAKTGRPRVHNVARALRDPTLAKTLGFKAFDLLELDGDDRQLKPYGERFTTLEQLFAGGRRCSMVITVQGERDEAVHRYDEWVASQKFEGLVVRSEERANTYKIKPAITIDAVVIAFGEKRERGVDQVRELQLALRRDDGSLHVLGPVGTGLSDADREQWHRRLGAMTCESGYRMANREGTLCRFVRPEIVVEIRCADLLATDTADVPARRMTLSYDPDLGYAPLAVMPLPSLIHPVLLRERPDKLPDEANIGLDQAYAYIPFEGRDEAPIQPTLAVASVLRRGVWTKTTKDKTSVRKFVTFKTNKEELDPRHPPYVVCFTDFSPGRKEPLQTSLRVASTEARLDVHVEAWIDKNTTKRGWAPAE